MEKRNINIKLDSTKKDKFELTNQGFLVVDAFVTRTGIFDYYLPNGEKIREYRPEEEVFNADSMKSLELIPVTYNHPSEMITVDNVERYFVGTTGENVKRNNDYVACKVKLTNKDVIDYVLQKTAIGSPVEVSCGYDAEIEYVSGEHEKEGHYDAIQKNIKYNHLSIVDKGRAGKNVKLNFDEKEYNTMIFKMNAIKLDGFFMDEIDVDIDEKSMPVVKKLSKKIDEAVNVINTLTETNLAETKKVDELQAKLDKAIEEVKTLKVDVAELSNPESDKVKAILKERNDVLEVAKLLDVKADELSIKELKLACIKKDSESFNEEGKSEDYVNAFFDAVSEKVKEAKKETNNSKLGEFNKQTKQELKDAKDPRTEFIAKTKDAWKSEATK